MVDDSVGRTRSVAGMAGFAGRPKDQQAPAAPRKPRSSAGGRHDLDEVCLHWDEGSALRLLRERVLAATWSGLGCEAVAVPMFAELVERESPDGFLGRLLSAQNQVAAHAAPRADLRCVLAAALDAGLAETRELVADLGAAAVAAFARIAAEVADRRERAAAGADSDVAS